MNEDIQKIIEKELNGLRDRIINNIVASGQNASGETINSLRVEVDGAHGILFGRSPFGTLETGRKAGGVPANFTQIIIDWIKAKGIQADPVPYVRAPSTRWQPKYTSEIRGLMSLAGAIAHKIQTHGTKLFRDGGRNDVYSNEIPLTIENIMRRTANAVIFEIDTITLNLKKDANY